MLTRRRLLEAAGAGLAVAGSGFGSPSPFASASAGVALPPGLPAGVDLEAALESLPGKQPLVKLAYRPPNYEAPLEYFSTPITPNDRFTSVIISPTSPTSTPRRTSSRSAARGPTASLRLRSMI